jgi:hypothetical protein
MGRTVGKNNILCLSQQVLPSAPMSYHWDTREACVEATLRLNVFCIAFSHNPENPVDPVKENIWKGIKNDGYE